MKIHPLCLSVSFHPSLSSTSFWKSETLTKEGDDKLAPTSHKTATYTCDIISNVHAVSRRNAQPIITSYHQHVDIMHFDNFILHLCAH